MGCERSKYLSDMNGKVYVRTLCFLVLVLLFSSCRKSPEWHRTEKGYYIYGIANDKHKLVWEGPSKANLADGEGFLISYDKEGRTINRIQLNVNMGVVSDWTYIPYRSYRYLGEMKNNEPNGFGVLLKNDSIIIGSFKKGKLYNDRCYSYIQTKDGIKPCFSGTLKKGKVVGPAKYYKNGFLEFEGSMKKGYREGAGKEFNRNQLIFDGYYKKGVRNGFGKQYENNHLLYAGGWKNGQRHGTGKLYNEKGLTIYDGEWANGVFDGKGILYENGQRIEGKWEEGQLVKSISKSVFSEISHSTKRWLGNDTVISKADSLPNNISIADSQIGFIEQLQDDLDSYLTEEIEKRVEHRFGFWHMLRMILQPWIRSDVKRAKFAEKYFCKNLDHKDIQQFINNKIEYYNQNASNQKLNYVKLNKIETGSIVDSNVALKIFEREALETTDVLAGIVVDIVVCVVIAFLIGFIVGLLVPSLIPYLFIVDIILTVIAFGIGIYLSIFKTSTISIELEEQIRTLLIDNYIQYLDINDVIPQILGLL